MSYFKQFPLGTYSNTQVIDITRRAALRRSLVADSRAYLPYEVPAGMRADQVAEHYYNSPENVWMVYMSAGLVDPYHEWYLDQNDFETHIQKKYGSQERAIELTHCWMLDWTSDDTELSRPAHAALPPELKKYWEANYGEGANILSYRRREEDWTVSTNMDVRVSITPQNNVAFEPQDVVTIKTGSTRNGQAEVLWANSSVVKIGHVRTEGSMTIGAGQSIVSDSGANGAVTGTQYVSNTIPEAERSYWSRVSKYDHEFARNEQRKHIRLVDSKYVLNLTSDLKKTLSGL